MFSYYGSKSKIVDKYPSPKHEKIIEPFAGSARYALRWFDRDVLLVDKYPVIVDLWKWLQKASRKDIIALPDVKGGQDIREYNLCRGASLLIGFEINRGSNHPKNIVAKFQNWNERKAVIASNLYKIRHWEIRQGDYIDIDNQKATWFIDPPYQFGGEHYKESQINYNHLAKWCKSRKGQAIVCENMKADWLPFYPMTKMTGAYSQTVEAIWSNVKHDYQARQPSFQLMLGEESEESNDKK
jgi:site-specific DNA-adenine methylase